MVFEDIRSYPTYVINLDRRKDRWQTFTAQPAVRQFKKLERFSAVDGSKLDGRTDSRISLHTRTNILKKYRRSDYEILTLGAIGASLSHFSIWQKLLDTSAEYCVVFEDDTIVTPEILQQIEILSTKLPKQWDIWLLGCHAHELEEAPIGENGWNKVTKFTGAHAYVISRHAAAKFLEEKFPIEMHVEYQMCAVALLKGLTFIRHNTLRMQYEIEKTQTLDSDTFDPENDKSCPLCLIPDRFYEDGYGYYISRLNMDRLIVILIVLGVVGSGILLSRKKLT